MAENIRHRNFSRKYGSFSRIHDSVKGHINEIELKGLGLYMIIASRCINQEYIWCSQNTLAKESFSTVPTVEKYLKKLENTKPPLIKRVKRRQDKTDIIHLLQVPKVLKTFKEGTKNPLVRYKKSFSMGTKNSLYKPYKDKHIKRNRVKEANAKLEDCTNFTDVYFNELMDMFNKRFRKLNKTNKSKSQKSIRSLDKLNREGIKKKEIKKVLIWYLNPENMSLSCIPEISSMEEFCEKFHQVRDVKDDEGED